MNLQYDETPVIRQSIFFTFQINIFLCIRIFYITVGFTYSFPQLKVLLSSLVSVDKNQLHQNEAHVNKIIKFAYIHKFK